MEREECGERFEVPVEEEADVFRGGRDLVSFQNAPGDSGVCSSCDFDSPEVVLDAEPGEESGAEGLFAGAAAGEEGAVDVKQEEFQGHWKWEKAKTHP